MDSGRIMEGFHLYFASLFNIHSVDVHDEFSFMLYLNSPTVCHVTQHPPLPVTADPCSPPPGRPRSEPKPTKWLLRQRCVLFVVGAELGLCAVLGGNK